MNIPKSSYLILATAGIIILCAISSCTRAQNWDNVLNNPRARTMIFNPRPSRAYGKHLMFSERRAAERERRKPTELISSFPTDIDAPGKSCNPGCYPLGGECRCSATGRDYD